MIKNQFENIYNESVQKALQAKLKPEYLKGSEQYFCEQCNGKVDAEKGSKFVKFPKMLCLNLNRFDFDLTTFSRVKLSEFMSFPKVLNMNDYINGYEGIKNRIPDNSLNPNGVSGGQDNGFTPNGDNSEGWGGSISNQGKPADSKKSGSTMGSKAKVTTKRKVVTKAKGSAGTRGFLAEMRKKQKESGGSDGSGADVVFMEAKASPVATDS